MVLLWTIFGNQVAPCGSVVLIKTAELCEIYQHCCPESPIQEFGNHGRGSSTSAQVVPVAARTNGAMLKLKRKHLHDVPMFL